MCNLEERFKQVIFDPLGYIHPQRLSLPKLLSTPRQRAIINHMLIRSFNLPVNQWSEISISDRQLFTHWLHLPYICTLVGAQLLKVELTRKGQQLCLPERVRFFMSLPLRETISNLSNGHSRFREKIALEDIQSLGVCHVLAWQRCASESLLRRMRLLFSPVLDGLFSDSQQQLQQANVFLILQAIQYAKIYPDNV